jgi:hypothetical protein
VKLAALDDAFERELDFRLHKSGADCVVETVFEATLQFVMKNTAVSWQTNGQWYVLELD